MRLGLGFLAGALLGGTIGALVSPGVMLFAGIVGGAVGVNLANRGRPVERSQAGSEEYGGAPGSGSGHGASGDWGDGGDGGGD